MKKKSFILVTVVLFFEISMVIAIAQVKFCAVGDILLDRGVRRTIKKKGVNSIFEGIKPIISNHDLAFCNLECPVHPATIGRAQEKKYCFRGDPESVKAMKSAGFNVMCVANNHSLDWGREGFTETLRALRENDIFTIGGGKNHSEAIKPVFIEKNGLTFAFFGVVDFFMESNPRQSKDPAPAYAAMEQLTAEIKKVNNRVDFVIVSFHWGEEDKDIPNSQQVAYAHRVIDAGADLVLGHHPHILQSIECYKDRLILYSLGNFVFDNPRLPQRQTIIFSCEFQKGKIANVRIYPIIIQKQCPKLSSTNDAKKIFEKLAKLSKKYGVTLSSASNSIDLMGENNKIEFNIPIREWHLHNKLVRIYTNRLELIDVQSDSSCSQTIEDERFSIRDACLIQDSAAIRIYSIVGNPLNLNNSQLAVFPIDLEKNFFTTPLLEIHNNYNPWKIRSADIDGDGNDEILVGVWKSTKDFPEKDNQFIIYNRYGDMIYPKLFGSTLGFPFIDFEIHDINNDDKNELITLAIDQTGKRQVICLEWNEFGFNISQVLDSNYQYSNLLDFFKNID